MKVITSDMRINEEFNFGGSIFLAGPTPRNKKVTSWRIQAIRELEQMQYEGTVFVPERKDWKIKFDYSDQIEWELKGMELSDVIVFWVPRNLKTMPGFTTNVEFGMTINTPSKRMVYGRPDKSEKNRYLDYLYCVTYSKQPHNNLYETLQEAVNG